MGSGEVGGGGSVSWKIVHQDNQGRRRPMPFNAAPGEPVNDEVRVGPEAVGPPGGPERAAGRDPISFPEIGGTHGVPGHFRVALQYPTPEAAAAAKAAATVLGSSLVLFVKAIDRTPAPAAAAPNPNVNVPKEIRIDW